MLVLPLRAALLVALLAAPAAAALPSAPAIAFKRLDGTGEFDSRALIGKKVLVVRFQASWCRVCVEEAPGIQRIWVKYQPLGVEVVGILVQDTATDARRFLKAHGATYAAGLDPRLQIANRFGFKGTPFTVVINKRGEIVKRIHGRADDKALARVLDPLVKPVPKRIPPARLQ
jgi:peroxiredoxin